MEDLLNSSAVDLNKAAFDKVQWPAINSPCLELFNYFDAVIRCYNAGRTSDD